MNYSRRWSEIQQPKSEPDEEPIWHSVIAFACLVAFIVAVSLALSWTIPA